MNTTFAKSLFKMQPIQRKQTTYSQCSDDSVSTSCTETHGYKISNKGTIIYQVTPTLCKNTNNKQNERNIKQVQNIKQSLQSFEAIKQIQIQEICKQTEQQSVSEWDIDSDDEQEPQYIQQRVNIRKYTMESDFQDEYDDFDFEMEE